MATTIPTVNNGDPITSAWGNLVGARTTYLDAVMEDVLADWQSYPVQWLSSGTAPSAGNGPFTARYKQIGKRVDFEISLTMGSTTTLGTGSWSWTLPVGASQSPHNVHPLGRWFVNDVSTNNNYGGFAMSFGASLFCFVQASPLTLVVNNSPIAWAVGDHIGIEGSYHAA